ncbi:ComEC/Rec2 family competence protein [Microlunatus parietis]
MSDRHRPRVPDPGAEAEREDQGRLGDLRMVPIAIAAWAASVAGTAGQPVVVAVAAAVGLLLVISGAARRLLLPVAAGLVIIAITAAGALHDHRLRSGPVAELAAAEAVVALEVRTVADPRRGDAGPGGDYLSVRVDTVTVAGRGDHWRVAAPVLLIASGPALATLERLPVGTALRVDARLRAPDAGDDLAAIARVRGGVTVTAGPDAGLALVERVRAGLRAAVEDRTAEQRALVPALVLGDTSGITPELEEDFVRTGLTHLTAVSGANLTLLLAFLLLLARWCGVRGWWLRGVGLLGVIIFVALCRTEPSVLRAAAMGLVALAALGGGSRLKGLRNLGVAVVVLILIDPYLGRSAGFALSVLASGGIIAWASRWAAVLHRWLPKIIAESITVPLAAHLATLPVVTALSGTVSVVGIVANALAGPFVGPATVFGFAAAGLSLLHPWAAVVAGFGAAWSAQPILWVAHWGAAFPGAAWPWPGHPAALALLAGAGLAAAWLMPHVLARRWLALPVALIMAVGFLRPPVQPGWPPAAAALVACDVGQGDGLVVPVGGDQAVVVDAGPDPRLIDGCLDQLGIRGVPLLILSHFHADHVDGLAGVFDGRPVGELWVGPLPAPAAQAVAVQRLAADHGVRVRTPRVGERVAVGGTAWQVIGPVAVPPPFPGDDEGESSAENDASLALIATLAPSPGRDRGLRILFTGDLEPNGQRAILTSGVDLTVDVVKVPHHGSSRQDRDFLAATRARVAVASAGRDNDYGHPAPRTVALLESLGMTVLATSERGSIAITAAGELGAVVSR